MGFLDFLSPALTTATQAAGDYQGAQTQAGQQKQSDIIRAVQVKRQQQEDARKAALSSAQVKHLDAESTKLTAPAAPIYRTGPGGQIVRIGPDGAPTPIGPSPTPKRVKVKQQDGTVAFVDPEHPPQGLKEYIPPHAPDVQFIVSQDAQGNPVYAIGDKRNRTITPTDVRAKPAGGGGEAADMNRTRLTTAYQQATQADQIMHAFEEKLLSGQASISTAGAIAGKVALGGGALTSASSEAGLNALDPELAQYVRAAKAVAAAERLITPRGGSGALMQAEQTLSGAGPHASPALIQQARQYRHALITGLAAHQGTAPVPSGVVPKPSSARSPADDILSQYHGLELPQGHDDEDDDA